MPIRFACAQCAARVKTPDGSEGKKMKCPRCGHLQRVPEKGAAAITEDPPSETVEETTPTPPATTPQTEPAAEQPSSPPPEASAPTEKAEPTGDTETNAESDDPLAGLAAAGSGGAEANDDESHDDDSNPETDAPSETAPDQPAAASPKPRPRPTPQPVPNGGEPPAAEAPKSIPLSAHRPRPMPQPRPAGASGDSSPGSALSAQVMSPAPSAVAPEARARSLDINAGELPRARTRREITRIRAQLQVLIWLCRGIAIVIAAGAVELFLHAGRQNASVLTQVIFLAAGLAVAGLAVAVGQIAAKLRQTLTGS